MLEAEDEGKARKTTAAIPSSTLAVPASLHASLMARLDPLGPAKEVAQIGAIIGREFSHSLLAAVAHKPELELQRAVDRLISTGGPTPETVEYLLSRKIIGWGSETVGTDAGQALSMHPAFPAHTRILGENRYGLASLCNLNRLPPTGALLFAAPLKIVKGTGSPLRVLALVAK